MLTSIPAAELILTGRNIPAKEALELRMINEVVPDANVEARALEIAKIISSNSPDSVMALLYGEYWLLFSSGWQGLV